MDKNKFSELIRFRSELTHQLMPLVSAWKTGSKITNHKILLVRKLRIGQLFFYFPQISIIEITDSNWYTSDKLEWVGHNAHAYLLESFEHTQCNIGEYWLVECMKNNLIQSIEK